MSSLDNLERGQSSSSVHNDTDEIKKLLKIRKKQELKLIKKYDKTKINISKECWFLIDSKWLNAWSNFVNNPDEVEEPGKLSTKDLLCENGIDPLPGLKSKVDYRGVSPMVYFIFVDLYGKDPSPELCKYFIDIYKPSVPVEKQINIRYRAMTEANMEVNKVRPKWLNWKIYDDEEEDEDICCCGLTKQHVEIFIYWAITCWSQSRAKSGRKNIKYSNYKPLKNDKEQMQDDSQHAELMQEKRNATAACNQILDQEEGNKLEQRKGTVEQEVMNPISASSSSLIKETTRKKPSNISNQVINPVHSQQQQLQQRQKISTTLNTKEDEYEYGSSEDSDDEEDELMMVDAPADRDVQRYTWFSR